MASLTRPLKHPSKVMKGHHVLFWMMGFFGLMLVVNGVFLWAAITSFPGEDVHHSYLQGIHFNDKLSAQAHQEKMGWRSEVGLLTSDDGDVLVCRILGPDGNPLPTGPVTAEIRRAATQNSDIVLTLAPVGGGEYRASLPLLAEGAWHVIIGTDIRDGDTEVPFQAVKKIILQ
ncbi:FixH family protein [Hyphomonas chukchiensis]|uniref:FixH family protein n=1 Tax=Hyphomonas chukchiensis TaxID=1280947 RepID=UPI0030F5E9D4|tara:strand:+ start:1237 stop:1755 length:519 start_codon:yes stop_codon:yes gene_type:complete